MVLGFQANPYLYPGLVDLSLPSFWIAAASMWVHSTDTDWMDSLSLSENNRRSFVEKLLSNNLWSPLIWFSCFVLFRNCLHWIDSAASILYSGTLSLRMVSPLSILSYYPAKHAFTRLMPSNFSISPSMNASDYWNRIPKPHYSEVDARQSLPWLLSFGRHHLWLGNSSRPSVSILRLECAPLQTSFHSVIWSLIHA